MNDEGIQSPVSMLTALLSNHNKGRIDASGCTLVIYLPESEDSMTVTVPLKSRVVDVIRHILREHELKHMYPPLDYANPSNYELRMHEGLI